VGSSCGGLRIIRGALASGNPYTDFVWEENASGNETHAGFTPANNNAFVNFIVGNDTNDTLAVTNMAAATLGTFEPEDFTDLSTGGSDCNIYVSGRGQAGTATGTGSFTWSQTNAATISGTYAIRPKVPAGAAVEQTVTSWSDTSITFTADQDTLDDSVNLYLFVENDDGASNAAGEVVQFEAGGGSVELVVADCAHGHAADGVALVQKALLAVAEASHANAVDAVGLIPGYSLAVADALHGNAVESVVLLQANLLAVSETIHANAAENVALLQKSVLAVGDAAHSNVVDAVALVQGYVLMVAAASHSNVVESPLLSVAESLAVADATHTNTAEGVALVQQGILAVAEAIHSNGVDSVSLQIAGSLGIQDSIHANQVDNVSLVQASILDVSGAIHTHSVVSITLSDSVQLTVAEALHANAVDAVQLTPAHTLAVAAAMHLHAADAINLTQKSVLIVSDTLHAHLAGSPALRLPVTSISGDRLIVIKARSRTVIVAPSSRVFTIH
jgi:hypothetical protein